VKREKWCRSRVCLCDKVAACNWTVAASAALSRDKVAHSCDKIVGVTSILQSDQYVPSLDVAWQQQLPPAPDVSSKPVGRSCCCCRSTGQTEGWKDTRSFYDAYSVLCVPRNRQHANRLHVVAASASTSRPRPICSNLYTTLNVCSVEFL